MMQSKEIMKILFVCTGNTCRSPMAAGIFNALAQKAGLPVVAESCGIAASGAPATTNAVLAAAQYGGDISAHISCQVDADMIRSADRVFGMTDMHVRALISAFPQYASKIERLSEQDISDPFGGNFEVYNRISKQIYSAVKRIISRYEK